MRGQYWNGSYTGDNVRNLMNSDQYWDYWKALMNMAYITYLIYGTTALEEL